MNNFNPFQSMYYQIYMMPTYVPPQRPYYTPVNYYPHLMPPINNNLIIQNLVPSQSVSLPSQEPKLTPALEVRPASPDLPETHDASKLTAQSEQKNIKQEPKNDKAKKINRPLTYLTEKAFYMKQKLKQKQNGGVRLLRKRLKTKQQRKIKKRQDEKKDRPDRETQQRIIKRMPIAKDSQKEQKIVNRIRQKLAKQNQNNWALIPQQISNRFQLNQLCRTKYENLILRQIRPTQI